MEIVDFPKKVKCTPYDNDFALLVTAKTEDCEKEPPSPGKSEALYITGGKHYRGVKISLGRRIIATGES